MITNPAIRLASGLTLTLPPPARHRTIINAGLVEGLLQLADIFSANVTFGFLNDEGTFLTREQAMQTAKDCGQLLSSANTSATRLNTEMLW